MNDEVKHGSQIEASQKTPVVAVLKASSDTVVAVSSDGSIRELQPGDAIYAGEIIESGTSDIVLITLADGSVRQMNQGLAVTATPEALALLPVYEGGNLEFDELLAALAKGEDISETLEETAAGSPDGNANGPDDEQGQGALFGRTIERVEPQAGFDPDLPPRPQVDPTADTETILGGPTADPEFFGTPPDGNPDSEPEGDAIPESGPSVVGNVTENDDFGPAGPGVIKVVAVNGFAGNVGAVITGTYGGTITINGDGSYTYTPPLAVDNSAGNPVEVFSYTIQDANGRTAQSTISITISDGSPIANDDLGIDVPEDAPIVINVVANDIVGPDGVNFSDPSKVFYNNDATHGAVVYNNNGTFTYTPKDGVSGTDSFTYTITDGDGSQSTARVTLNLADDSEPVNQLTDGNETNSTLEDTTLTVVDGATGDLLNNTVNPDGPSTETITKFTWGTNIDVAAGTSANITGVGDLLINANGSYTFTPAADYDGAVPVISYTVTDGVDSVVSTLSLSITAVNDAPVALADTNWAQEDTVTVISGNVIAGADHNTPTAPAGTFADVADTDLDADPLTVASVGGVAVATVGGTDFAGTYGTLHMNADGSYTYTLYTQADNAAAYGVVQALDDGDVPLTDTFSYKANDGGIDSSAVNLTISIFGTNDAPTIAITDGAHTVYEAGLSLGSKVGQTTKEVAGTFTLTDTDGLDGLDSVKVNTATFTMSQLGAATALAPLLVGDTAAGALYITNYDSGTGVVSYKYVLDTAITDVPAVTEQDTFSVSVSDDGTTFSSPATITVTIVDDLPVQIIPDDLYVENKGVVGTSDQLISNLNFIAGADGVGSVKFNSADIDAGAAVVPLVAGATTSSTIAKDAAGNELSIAGVAGLKLYLYLSADGTTLTASVGTTAGGTVGYIVTLNGSGGTYTFNPEAVISNGTEVTATSLSSVGGGNLKAKVLSNLGGTQEDVLLTTKAGLTVNTNANTIGIGQGNSLGTADGIRFDFVNGNVTGSGSNAEYTPNGTHNLTTQFRQQVTINGGSSDHADFTLKAILAETVDDNVYYGDPSGETPINITSVVVYSGTLAQVQAGTASIVTSDITLTYNPDGSVNIVGLKDGWTYEIQTTSSFSALQIDSLSTTSTYKLGAFSYGAASDGLPIDLNYNIIGTDGDGDTVAGMVDVSLYPDGLSSTGANLTGTSGADILLGTNGNDTLNGAGGADILAGNAGNDALIGGQGSDQMSGGSGADIFKWLAGDAAGSPIDTITDFNTGQGDVLDLKALLVDETDTALDLTSFLTFSLVGGDTHIAVDTNGSVTGGDTQTIVLQGMDLVTGGGSQADIIQTLMTGNNLLTDVV